MVLARSHGAHGYLWKSYRKALSTVPSFPVWLTGDCGNTAHVHHRFSITRALEGSSGRHRGHRPHALPLGPSRNLPLSTGCRPHGTRKQFPTNHARRDSGENTCPFPSDTCLPALHPLTVPAGQLKGVDRPQGGNVPEAPPPGPCLWGGQKGGVRTGDADSIWAPALTSEPRGPAGGKVLEAPRRLYAPGTSSGRQGSEQQGAQYIVSQ